MGYTKQNLTRVENQAPNFGMPDDLEARLARVEQLAQSYRKELDIQFRRIADLQAVIDSPMADGRRKERRKPPN